MTFECCDWRYKQFTPQLYTFSKVILVSKHFFCQNFIWNIFSPSICWRNRNKLTSVRYLLLSGFLCFLLKSININTIDCDKKMTGRTQSNIFQRYYILNISCITKYEHFTSKYYGLGVSLVWGVMEYWIIWMFGQPKTNLKLQKYIVS